MTGEDNQEYLLPSQFGIKLRSPEEISMDIDGIDGRLSMIEDMIARRVISRH